MLEDSVLKIYMGIRCSSGCQFSGGMSGEKILIVEDDPVGLKLARDALQAIGFETDEATDGEDALYKVAQTPPDLIVMDIQLPGMDGLEVTRRLKNNLNTRSIPVIVVTARAIPGDADQALDAGCQAYLPKPLNFKEFVATVKRLLEGD